MPFLAHVGMGPALILVSHGAIQFVIYEWMKETYKVKTSMHYLLVGGLSKMIASILTYPYQVLHPRKPAFPFALPQTPRTHECASQVVKARLQNQRHRVNAEGENLAKYKGTLHCFRTMLREEGLRAFFKGCFPNAVRVAPASAINLLTYETVVAVLSPGMRTR
eukprot:scaffold302_cov247-Pinguiococcus_pyrenoidosus.AAC.4